MKRATQILILTFVIVGVYLLVRNSAPYKSALAYASGAFAKAYGALVKGQP